MDFWSKKAVYALSILSLFLGVLCAEENLMDKEAFEESMEDTFPLTPNQIDTIKRSFDKRNELVSTPPFPHPEGQTSTRSISLSPGSEIPLVRLTKGYISTLVFLDQTGQPWPVANYSIGDPSIFNIQWDSSSNVLFVQPQKVFAHGNIGIRLVGSPTPIMLQLACGRSDVDYRIDLTLPGEGPNARPQEMSLGDNRHPIGDELSPFLDGKNQIGSTPLTLVPAVGQAWSYKGYVILRTQNSVISPKWLAVSSSSDGMKVYKLPKINTVVLSQAGKTQSVRIEGL